MARLTVEPKGRSIKGIVVITIQVRLFYLMLKRRFTLDSSKRLPLHCRSHFDH